MYPYINIFGRTIGTYGVCMVVGFLLAGFLAWRKGRPYGIRIEDILIIGAMTLGCAVLGGGLLYAFTTYSWSQILTFIKALDFSFMGGIVFYGGLIGGVLGALLGIKIAGCPLGNAERAIIPFVPLGHAIGRVGCVMGGCCHGFEYEGIFALYYPNSITGLPPEQGYFPVQPLESLVNVVICLVLLYFSKRVKRVMDLMYLYLSMYAVSRFFLEMLRGDDIRGIWSGGLSTSQIVSIVLLILCAVHLAVRKKLPLYSEK